MQKIIDSHIHLGKSEKCSNHFSVEEYEKYMADHDISAAIVMPNITNLKCPSAVNENFIRDFPRPNLHPCILIDSDDSRTLTQMRKYGIAGVKYHPSVSQKGAAHIDMEPYWKECEALNLFAIVHCGRNLLSRICGLIKVAERNPCVNFIGAHLGGGSTDLIEKALKFEFPPNLYLDIAASKVPRLIEMAVDKIGADKIIFGSDEPYADYRVTKYCMELADVHNKEKIYYKNAARLLKYENSTCL